MGVLKALVAGLALTAPKAAQAVEAPMFDAPTLTDAELADARGGFSLGGAKIDFGAVVTTTLDGVRLLQTQLRINEDGIRSSVAAAPGVNVTINGVPAQVTEITSPDVASPASATADAGVDTPDIVSVSFGVPSGDAAVPSSQANEILSASVALSDFSVQHLIGRNISSVIVNTGDNRVVDNQVAINLRLDNVSPLSLGSIGFQIQNMSLDASTMRAP